MNLPHYAGLLSKLDHAAQFGARSITQAGEYANNGVFDMPGRPIPAAMGTAMRHSLCLAGLFLGATLMAGAAGPATAGSQQVAQLPGPESGFERCRTITNDAERLRCYEAATAKRPDQAGANVAGTWRLVRTPNPATGESAISIMQTADVSRSDLDLAGLMVRCAEATTEVLVVLVRPLPPRAQPKVTVAAAGQTVELTANVVAPGLMLLLPPQANALAASAWQAAPDLTITVADETAPIRGVIPLGGLGTALRELRANCLAR